MSLCKLHRNNTCHYPLFYTSLIQKLICYNSHCSVQHMILKCTIRTEDTVACIDDINSSLQGLPGLAYLMPLTTFQLYGGLT